jgi:predicted transcriptional regulator
MPNDMTQVLVKFPKELVDRVDQLVGVRNRTAFFAEAVTEKLDRARLERALARTAGFIPDKAHPEWQTPEMVSDWVRELRALDRDTTGRPTDSGDRT